MNKVLNFISDKLNRGNILLPESAFLLTLSGGQDSGSLLYLTHLLQNQWAFNCQLIYCNHLWQRDSIYISYHLMAVAHVFNRNIFISIPFSNFQTETKARYWRYTSFHRILLLTEAKSIMTGHTCTDQVESFLFNLTRGIGSRGATALTFQRFDFSPGYFCFSKKKRFLTFSQLWLLQAGALRSPEQSAPAWSTSYACRYRFRAGACGYKAPPSALRACVIDQATGPPDWLLQGAALRAPFGRGLFNGISAKPFRKMRAARGDRRHQRCRRAPATRAYFSCGIFRPLLIFNRYEISQLVQGYSFPIWSDSTNSFMQYSRNRIRFELLPLMRFYFNQQTDQILKRFLEIWSEETIFFERFTQTILNVSSHYYICKNPRKLIYNASLFLNYPYIFQKRLVLKTLPFIYNDPLDFRFIQTLIKTILVCIQTAKSKQNPLFFITTDLILTYSNNQIILITR